MASATLAHLHTFPRRFVVAFEGILDVYGGDFFHISENSPFGPGLGGLPPAAGVALAAVHLAGVALAVWGFFRAFRHFFDPGDLVSPVLATAIAVNVAAYALSIVSACPVRRPGDPGRAALRRRPGGAHGHRFAGQGAAGQGAAHAGAAAGLAGVLACYLAALGYGAAQSPVPDNEQAIIPWLEAHHLTNGLGTYAEANLITLDSGGRLAIRDVSWRSAGDPPRHFETKSSWYDPRHSYANFILTNSADQWGMDGGHPHRPDSHDPAQRRRGPARRAARACLPLQDVHHHGLEPQPPERPGQESVDRPRRGSLHSRLRVAGGQCPVQLKVAGKAVRLLGRARLIRTSEPILFG